MGKAGSQLLVLATVLNKGAPDTASAASDSVSGKQATLYFTAPRLTSEPAKTDETIITQKSPTNLINLYDETIAVQCFRPHL